jgi:predicted RNase H-like HicB family nuclease
MKVYSAVIERDPQTRLFVGFVPGFPGAHSQGATLDELNHNLQEVIAMLLEDGDPQLESEFVGGSKRCCWLSFGQPSRS